MASRLYYAGSTSFAGIAYAPDSHWHDTGQSTALSTNMTSTRLNNTIFYGQSVQKNTSGSAAPYYILHTRFRYPLPVGVTLSGYLRGQLFGQATSGGVTCRALSVRVLSDTSAHLPVDLIQHFPLVVTSAFALSYQNRYFVPSEASIASYTTVTGDVLIVEVGSAWFTAAPGGIALIRFGDASVIDLPVDETASPGAPEQCGWLEFESANIFGNPDPYLLTLSGDIAVRPAAPDVRGLHFIDITANNSHWFWDAVKWSRLFQESLATLADRTKLLTLTDTTTGPLLLPSGPWTANYLMLSAPTAAASRGLVVDPNGFIGAFGNLPVGLAAGGQIMNFSLTAPSAMNFAFSGIKGIVVVGVGNGGAATALTGGFFQTQYSSTVANALEQIGVTAIASITNAAGTGDATGVQGQIQCSGITTRVNVTCFKALPLSGINGTITTLRGFWYKHINAAVTLTNTIPFDCDAITRATTLACSFRQNGVHTAGATRRGALLKNTIECDTNRFLNSAGAGLGYVMKDGQGSPHYWELAVASDGTPYFADIGTSAPAV